VTDDDAAAPLPPNVDDAEKRLRRLLERRNELNAEAREIASERDQLNAERRRVLDGVAELRARREAIHAELQQHKARRTELQRQAKELLDAGAVGDVYRANLTSTSWFRPQAYFGARPWRGRWRDAGGGVLIDTPGMRELQLWDAQSGLEHAFADIDELARTCRFRDCSHDAEPGCAVTGAVAEGQLDSGRLDSYRRLQREERFLESRLDEGARADRSRYAKQMSRALRQSYKLRQR
jgi:hypothetical protein